MKKMLSVYAVLLLIACVFALTACPSGSSTSAGGSISHSSGGSGSGSSTRTADKTVPNSSGNSSSGTTSGSSTGSTSDSSGGSAGPSDPSLKTYVLKAEGGKANLTLKDYNTSTFTGTYTFFMGENPDQPKSEDYSEKGTFEIIKIPQDPAKTSSKDAKNGWIVTFKYPVYDNENEDYGTISSDKILERWYGRSPYKFPLGNDFPLPAKTN